MALQTKKLTASGSKGHHYFVLNVNEENINNVDNTSSLSFNFILSNYGGKWDWYYWGQQISYSININGKVYSGYIPNYDGVSTVTITNGTLPIEHNSDGSKSINISFSVTDNTGQTYTCGNASASDSMELTTIPRESDVSGGSGNIGSKAIINITRASDDFTHTLEYEFGNLTGTIATEVATSYEWTIPTEFYKEIPNSNTGTGTITCKTYNGDSLIGTKTTSFTATVTNSNPEIGTFSYKDTNPKTTSITKDNQRIIRENSNLLFTIGTATAKNSATISKYEITFNGITKSRTSDGDLDFGTINLSSNETAILKVTDSRGNTDTKEITIIIDDWVLPTALITLNRKNNFYSETYIKVDGTYSNLNGKNSMTIQYQYKEVSATEYSKLVTISDNVQEIVDLDNNFKWNIKVIITDKIGTTIYNLFLDRGMPITFFDRLLSSVGINCFPKLQQSLEVAGEFLLNNKSVLDLMYPIGSIYMTIDSSADPSINFGGEWEQIIDSSITIGYAWKRIK